LERRVLRADADAKHAADELSTVQLTLSIVRSEKEQLEIRLKAAVAQYVVYSLVFHPLHVTVRPLCLSRRCSRTSAAESAQSRLTKEMRDLQQQNEAAAKLTAQSQQELISMREKFEKDKKDYVARLQKQIEAMRADDQNTISILNLKLMEAQSKPGAGTGAGDLKSSAYTVAEVQKLKAREKELGVVLAKLVLNEEASEASFTCFACMNILNNPVTCIPCGHSFCRKCVEKTGHCHVRRIYTACCSFHTYTLDTYALVCDA
jgi:hypothetical protein